MTERATVKARVEFSRPVRIGNDRTSSFAGETMRDRDGLVCFYTTKPEDRSAPARRSTLVPWANVTCWEAEVQS